MEDKKNYENKFDDLIVTEKQLNFLNENNLLEEIKRIVNAKNLVNVEMNDFNLILKDREIIGFINDQRKDFEIIKLKDGENIFAIVHIEGALSIFETNEIINKIRNSFSKDMTIIYSLGSEGNFKVFALIVA